MEISDIISIVEIIVTLILGYYISHWMAVKDQRTRSVKDYYIKSLCSMHDEVDDFFKQVLSGHMYGRTISDWYGNHEEKLMSFDEGVRMALPLRKKKLSDIINDIHSSITGSEFFNDHFYDESIIYTNQEKVRLIALKQSTESEFNEYIIQINNSRQKNFLETFIQNFRLENKYHREVKNARWPYLYTCKNRILKGLPLLIILCFIIWVINDAINSYQIHQDEEKSAKKHTEYTQSQILRCLQQQGTAIENFSKSYKPIQVSTGKQYSNVKFSRTINKCSCDTTNIVH
jgi:hypothetical protein